LAARFNRPDLALFDYDVYALAGDGCMMEGISNEAASLAGHLRLANLCWILGDDVPPRFLSYGWNVTRVGDANDLEMLDRAFATFQSTSDRPTLIIVDSHIAYGAPHKQDTSAAHGEPLGEDGAGDGARLGAIRRARGAHYRHAHLRGVGAAPRAPAALRLHAGGRDRDRPRAR